MLAVIVAIFAVGSIVFGIAGSLYYAWAAHYLWAWFIVPVFNVPALTILQAWGICLTIRIISGPRLSFEKKNTDAATAGLFGFALGPLFTLGIGYALRFWWM